MVNKREWDSLMEKYGKPSVLKTAQQVLDDEDQSEEAFLGAQCVLLLHGLI